MFRHVNRRERVSEVYPRLAHVDADASTGLELLHAAAMGHWDHETYHIKYDTTNNTNTNSYNTSIPISAFESSRV